jgi:hypothetical protein
MTLSLLIRMEDVDVPWDEWMGGPYLIRLGVLGVGLPDWEGSG